MTRKNPAMMNLGGNPRRKKGFRRLVQFIKIQNYLTPEFLKIPDVYIPVLTSMEPGNQRGVCAGYVSYSLMV